MITGCATLEYLYKSAQIDFLPPFFPAYKEQSSFSNSGTVPSLLCLALKEVIFFRISWFSSPALNR